ncbi:MAG: ATP-binding protein [Aquabacterium sp.]|nr:ATP-binding protein [Aquabacterium sp.]
MVSFSQPLLDRSPSDAKLQARVWSERMKMLCSHVPTVMGLSVGFALALCWLLRTQVDALNLACWFGLRSVVVLARFSHARMYMSAPDQHQTAWYRGLLALVFLDGLLWGATWWWLVPVDRMELTAITLTAIMGVASLSAFILHADTRSAACHLLPMLLPSALYSLTRHDAYGLFGSFCLLTFAGFLLFETHRTQARLLELLTLRFVHESVLQEREQALALAQFHSEAKSSFLASMSHEMRTPLHGILGLTRLLSEDEARPVAQRRLALLERSGEHLLTVINDVLDISKIESGHVQVDSQPFDLSVLVAEVAEVSTVTANRKGLHLLLQNDLPTAFTVRGDAMRVRQILHNLLGNAIKFTDKGRVTLHVARRTGSDHIAFVVTDTGVGIPEAEQRHIFDAFHQVNNALDTRYGGTGLGLSISRQLCMAMGGDLSCASQKGVGSSFECLLALPETQLTLVPSAELSPPDVLLTMAHAHVLLVEDNPINAMVAEAALRQIGVQVHLVDDGSQAVTWLGQHHADLVLMDCQMPVMDGFEASRRIRSQELALGLKRVPIIALSANVFAGERARCLESGMDDHLGKPFYREDLHKMLARHMQRGAQGARQAA